MIIFNNEMKFKGRICIARKKFFEVREHTLCFILFVSIE